MEKKLTYTKKKDRERLLPLVRDLFIQGYNSIEIAQKLTEKFPNQHTPSIRTIQRWIVKHRGDWELKRKQAEILKIKQANEDKKSLYETIEEELQKAEALDYQTLCELQERYKEIAMKEYRPRAVEVVLACIRLKCEIRKGLKPEEEKRIIVSFEGIPEKSNEVIYEGEVIEEREEQKEAGE